MFKFIKKGFNFSQSRQHIAGLQGTLCSRLGSFRQGRSDSEQDVLSYDFNAVLEAWGISHESVIPYAIKTLRLRYVIFALPMLFALVSAFIMQNVMGYLTLVCVLLPCFFGFLTTTWRISILKQRRFIPFSSWLLSILPFICPPK